MAVEAASILTTCLRMRSVKLSRSYHNVDDNKLDTVQSPEEQQFSRTFCLFFESMGLYLSLRLSVCRGGVGE